MFSLMILTKQLCSNKCSQFVLSLTCIVVSIFAKPKTRRNRYNRGIRTIRESIKSIVSYSFIINTTICMAEDSPG